MRVHQTARVKNRNGSLRQPGRADLPGGSFFPAVSTTESQGNKPLAHEGAENSSLGEFKNTNLINYNFNNNAAQEQASDEDGAFSNDASALPRPRNTKGGPRIGRADGTCGSDDAEAGFNSSGKSGDGNYFSMRGVQKPNLVDENVRQTTYSANYGQRQGARTGS